MGIMNFNQKLLIHYINHYLCQYITFILIVILGVFCITGCNRQIQHKESNLSASSPPNHTPSPPDYTIDSANQQTSSRAMNLPTKHVSGHIIDSQKKTIPGVNVTVSLSDKQVIGQGTSNDQGYFFIELDKISSDMVTMAATKKDYARWALFGSPKSFVDCEIRMYREIDDSFMAEIINEPNQAQRQKLVLEIVGDRIGLLDVKDIFPILGIIRPDLIQIIKSAQYDVDKSELVTPDQRYLYQREHWQEPSERARFYLEYWHDPNDQHLFTTLPFNISGETIEHVCDQWTDYHFTPEKVERRPHYEFSDPIFGPDKKRALITFSVHYARRGYSMNLVLIHDNLYWNLVYVFSEKRWTIR